MTEQSKTSNLISLLNNSFLGVGKFTQKNGTQAAAVTAGVIILIAVVAKSIIIGSFEKVIYSGKVVNDVDLALIMAGVLVILTGLILGSLDYRWYNDYLLKEKQIIYSAFKLELEKDKEKTEAGKEEKTASESSKTNFKL